MNPKTKKYLLIGGVVVIAAFVGYKFWKKRKVSTSSKTLEDQKQAAKTQMQKATQKTLSKIAKKPKN
jgi:predicted negative regulator of RcsB-dependent stress response